MPKRTLADEEIIAGLRQRPLDKYAQAAADRLEELLHKKGALSAPPSEHHNRVNRS